MALILDDPSFNGRQLGYLVPLHRAGGLYLLNLCWQKMSTVLALLWQHGPNLIDSWGG
jgi:hypothetical protein